MTHKQRLVTALGWAMLGLGILGARGAELAGQAAAGPASDVQNPIVIPPPDAAGGGWACAGPEGAYFNNPDLAGEPAFTRRDVRVDFYWGKFLPVGGSPAEPYKSFPRSRFSVRWTGRVLPRFSEDYVFTVRATAGVRLKLKPAGADEWMLAVDQWGKAGAWNSQPVRLAAGQLVDVILEYHHLTGPAAVKLSWSCPSAPRQVVDPVVAQALNVGSWQDYCWADECKTSRLYGYDMKKADEHGCPTTDAQLVVNEGKVGVDGTYDLIFQGRAKVAWQRPTYDPASNTTRAKVRIGNKEGLSILDFKATQRRPGASAGNGGVTGLHLMRPIRPGADTAHRLDEIVYRPLKKAVAPYTCLRWLQVANQTNNADWSKRTHPDYLQFTRRDDPWSDANTGGECWELLVVLANECGKDLYVALPMQAEDAYIEKFARLIRYGSDGVEPYDHEVENPKWPPLNPNLRLYVEVGNEIWNWAFGSTQYCLQRNDKEIKARSPDGKIVNYGGESHWRRWHALRTVRASDAFRRASGDAAMGSRVRMLMEYQYNNEQGTAAASFNFLDNWFNNGDGPHEAEGHPVRHWIWGGGGATYYGVGNGTGSQSAVRVPDGNFEDGVVPDGSQSSAPAGCGWTCSGAAAIYRNRWVSVNSFAGGRQGRVSNAVAAGCTFRVDKPLYLRELGCWLRPWVGPHDLYLLGPQGLMAHVKVKPLQFTMSETEGWSWAAVAGTALRLEPGVDYHLLAKAENGGLSLFQDAVKVAAGAGFRIVGAAKVAGGADLKNWKVERAGEGALSFGPVAVRATSAADTKSTGLPDPPLGGQAAVLRAGGVLRTKIPFPKAGHYALELHAAGPAPTPTLSFMPFSITVGGKSANPLSQGDERLSADNFGIGGWERRTEQPSEVWGSGVFAVDAPGEVELRIAAMGKDKGWTMFDDIRIASVDALMESGFGAGEAFGQVAQNNYAKQLNNQVAYARSFGLPVVAYEAGWSLGGDFGARPIQTWCKFNDPRATRINDIAEDIFLQSGGFMNTWGVYIYWPPHDMTGALSYPLMRSLAGVEARLPPEPTNGIPLPARLELKPGQMVPWGYGDFRKRGQWNSWLALVPRSGVWTFTVRAQGAGIWELEVDGVPVARGSGMAAAPAAVRLVQGQHGVRLRNRGGSFQLDAIAVAAAK